MATKNDITETFGGVVFSDSYPHTTNDSGLWLSLFCIVYEKDRELFAKLNYLRGAGTLLEKTYNPKMPYKLVPIIGDNGWQDEEEWTREKQCLNKHIPLLIEVLKQI